MFTTITANWQRTVILRALKSRRRPRASLERNFYCTRRKNHLFKPSLSSMSMVLSMLITCWMALLEITSSTLSRKRRTSSVITSLQQKSSMAETAASKSCSHQTTSKTSCYWITTLLPNHPRSTSPSLTATVKYSLNKQQVVSQAIRVPINLKWRQPNSSSNSWLRQRAQLSNSNNRNRWPRAKSSIATTLSSILFCLSSAKANCSKTTTSSRT